MISEDELSLSKAMKIPWVLFRLLAYDSWSV